MMLCGFDGIATLAAITYFLGLATIPALALIITAVQRRKG